MTPAKKNREKPSVERVSPEAGRVFSWVVQGRSELRVGRDPSWFQEKETARARSGDGGRVKTDGIGVSAGAGGGGGAGAGGNKEGGAGMHPSMPPPRSSVVVCLLPALPRQGRLEQGKGSGDASVSGT